MRRIKLNIRKPISGWQTSNRMQLDGKEGVFISEMDLLHSYVEIDGNKILVLKDEIEFIPNNEIIEYRPADTIIELLPNGTESRINKKDLLKGLKLTVTDEDIRNGYAKT